MNYNPPQPRRKHKIANALHDMRFPLKEVTIEMYGAEYYKKAS